MPKFRKPLFRKGPLSFRYILVITLIAFVIMTLQGLWLINTGIKPTLIEMAETKTRQFATLALNEAVSKKLVEEYLQTEELVTVEKNDSGEVSSVGWNSLVMNKILRETTFRVQEYLDRVEEGKVHTGLPNNVEIETTDAGESRIVYYVPLGQATNNVLLANLGPKVPVRFTVIGDVESSMDHKVTEYGINNVLIEISVQITVTVQIIIPFATEPVTVTTSYPINIQSIQGDVPYFYNSGGEGLNPSFEPPLP